MLSKFRAGSSRPLRVLAFVIIILALIPLAGCLYPEDQTPGNQVSVRQAVMTVQDAVDRYKKDTGLLPIENADQSVPLYEKFKIDFGKMKRMGYIDTVPKVAFENGGKNQFLIIDEETNPTVKLLDLAVFQGIATVQNAVLDYWKKHGGNAPAGDKVYPGLWSIDFSKLDISDPKLQSMYSGQTLNLITDQFGHVYADYGSDLAAAVRKSKSAPKADVDLRRVLVDQSYYVPVKSPIYKWVGGEPQGVAE